MCDRIGAQYPERKKHERCEGEEYNESEDGDFEAKVRCLEELDERIPRLRGLGPDVLVVAGDHATPAIMAGHSWHPVPMMVNSPLTKGDGAPAFHERACSEGSLGRLPATELMLLAMAHAGKLVKYGP